MQWKGHYNILLIFIFLSGCADTTPNQRTVQDHDRRPVPSAEAIKLSGKIEQPLPGDLFTIGDNIEIVFSPGENAGQVETISLTVDGKDAVFSGSLPGSIYWNSAGQVPGNRHIILSLSFEDGITENYPLRLVLKSDIIPVQYTYRVVNSYPHDIRAFTQGLVYEGGFLYESTGQYGQSTLRKVVLETGEVLRSLNLDRDMFGEGLCVHDGKLYQLTWKSQVGFIYDIESFRLLNKVHYQTEGWGLTSDGKNLFKSDGSHHIYILDPHYFAEVGRIEVFDHIGMVGNINELELIGDLIYANIFGADEIVMIDRHTGRVTGVADLTGLLDRRYHHSNLDVLNGIAYDHENDRLFVTGKNWPRLFEIELVQK